MSGMLNSVRLGWRQFRRDLIAGHVRMLIAALVLAVVAVTAVGFVTDRAQRALALEANRLLGGDAVVRADAPIAPAQFESARRFGLRSTQTVELTSMIRASDTLQLGDLRALGEGFPLRGRFELEGDADSNVDASSRMPSGVPAQGTLWLSRAGAERLGAKRGDRIGIGDIELRLVALVTQEPDAALDYFNVAPRAFFNLADLPATGLVQEGSRIRYRHVVAGDASAVEKFVGEVRGVPVRGQRIETAADARPEIRSALDRAGRFLGLAALVSVVLAAIAVAMAARRHSAQHVTAAAVMRCLGASQRTLLLVHVGELLWIGIIASAIGVAIAFALQWGIGAWLSQELGIDIPPAGPLPALEGFVVGLVVLLAFGAPPVLALRRVSALRVLRREGDRTEPAAWTVAVIGIAGVAALLWWKAGSAALGGAMLVGIAATLAALATLAMLMIAVVRRARVHLRGPLRYGLANVARRAGSAVAQVSALGLGLMALLLLTLVRTDLLDRWQLGLAADAPNRFVINVQPDQVDAMASLVAERGIAAPTLWPLVRARLVKRNGVMVSGTNYAEEGDERAQRFAEREFNLSSASRLRKDNTVIAGRFWTDADAATPQFSVEEDFATRLGWKIGDRIAFDVAGQTLEAPITSLRKVDWESFQPNFFVLAPPAALEGFAASFITALQVPARDTRFTADLVRRFPNLSVIDIDQVLKQVRATADQVSTVVEVVFYFAIAAGILVLLAAINASQDERLLEGGVMRALGASGAQLRLAQASEFAALGLIAGIIAATAATILSGVIATRVFDLDWQPDLRLAVYGAVAGVVTAVAAGLAATRRVVLASPMSTLRELNA